MKKILSLALVVMFILGIATTGFCEVYYVRGPDSRVLTECTTGATATLSTSITTNNRIMGIEFTDSSAGSVGIYDTATAGDTPVTKLILEASCAAGYVSVVMFPLPRNITYGLVVKNSASTGSVTVFYE
jgi:hypothetical protein